MDVWPDSTSLESCESTNPNIPKERTMHMDEIKNIARSRGLNPGRLKKVDLVRAIQNKEGNESCFQTGQAGECGQDQCLWREDCLK